MKTSKEGLTLAGSIVAAIAASACCIGPVVLALAGLGGAAFTMKLQPYRPWFIGLTVVMLGAAFFFVYRRPAEQACGTDETCTPSSRRGMKIVLWAVTLMALAALALPLYVNYLV